MEYKGNQSSDSCQPWRHVAERLDLVPQPTRPGERPPASLLRQKYW